MSPAMSSALDDEAPINTQLEMDSTPTLDADGGGYVTWARPQTPPATTRPLVVDLTVRLQEHGGRAVEKTVTEPFQPEGAMIGVRPEFEAGQVEEGSTARFDVIVVDPAGERVSQDGLSWSLLRIERDYQWYREGNRWRYEPVEYTAQVENGTIEAGEGAPAQIAVTVDWGRYRLTVESNDAGGPATSVEFDAGWYVSAASTETPDGLEIALDRDRYRAGDTAKLLISPRFAGEALITVSSDRLYDVFTATVPDGGTEIGIPVDADWGAGAYVTATLIRPGGDADNRMPSRAVGIKVAVDRSGRPGAGCRAQCAGENPAEYAA